MIGFHCGERVIKTHTTLAIFEVRCSVCHRVFTQRKRGPTKKRARYQSYLNLKRLIERFILKSPAFEGDTELSQKIGIAMANHEDYITKKQ